MSEKEKLSASRLRVFFLISALEGIVALFFTFRKFSEPRNVLWGGYSLQRWLIGIIILFLMTLLLQRWFDLYGSGNQNPRWLDRINQHLASASALINVKRGLVILMALLGWIFLFTWLFIPASLRPISSWLLLVTLQFWLLLRQSYQKTFCALRKSGKSRLLPRLADLDVNQRKVLLTLVVIALIYIAILMPSNFDGTQDFSAFQHYGGDEFVIYPILMDVMAPGDTFSATLYHLFIYEDYHYGYPFYAWSTLVLLPVKWLSGANFPDLIHINLPLLRVFVSVVPLILACLVLVFIGTRFRNGWISAAIFLFLLLAPGSLQNNQGFWHPDGLNLLFVCLVLYFLQRDHYRYGHNFYLAALFTGLSAAIRLYGFFFFLAIAIYLVSGLLMKKLTIQSSLKKGSLFILTMAIVILYSSPFLFRADARGKMVAILQEKSGEMAEGYPDDYDPRNDYRPGWDAWYPAFEDHYTEMFCFFFLIFSAGVASFVGGHKLAHRMTACWCAVILIYLIFFVAVKSTQYVLPALLPLMSCIFSLPLALESANGLPTALKQKWAVRAGWLLSGSIFLAQLVINLIKITPRFR